MLLLHLFTSSAGENYAHVFTDVTFNASTPIQTVNIPILDNEIVAGSTMFSVSLTSADPAAILNPTSADITIEDDDSELHWALCMWDSKFLCCLIITLTEADVIFVFYFLLQWSQLDSMDTILCVKMLELLVLLYWLMGLI